MRAREIEKWMVHIMQDGATELVDAEIAKHIVRVYRLCEALGDKNRPRDALVELRGYDDTMGELHVSLGLLRARAAEHERVRLRRETSASPSAPAAAPAGAP